MIRKVAAAITDSHGRVLLVRTRYNGHTLIAPGGRPHDGESEEQTLRREIREELGAEIQQMTRLGTFTDHAALHPGQQVHMTVYRTVLRGEPRPCGEITELVWTDGTCGREIGSIMRDHVIPLLNNETGGNP